MHKFLTLPFYVKFACTLISIIALVYIAKIGQTIIAPLILGSLIALLLLPFARFMENKLRFPRTLAAIVALLLFTTLVIGVFTLIGSQLTHMKEDWPAFEQQIVNGIKQLQKWVETTFHINYSEQMNYITDTATKSIGQGTAILGIALLSVSSLFVLLVFTFLYTFFILIYRSHIVRFFLLLNNQSHHNVVMDIVMQIQYVVKRYLIGLVIQMFIVAALTFIALSIIGIKYSLMLAIITGVLNVLPYIGIFTSMLIVSIIAFATSSLTHVLFVVLAMVLVHVVDGNFVVPKIVGSKVQINSLFAMLAIIVGEMLWGISGMFLAIPVLAICKIIFDRIKDLKPWGYLLGEEEQDKKQFIQILEIHNEDKK